MSDLWRVADKASERFAAEALDYDRYRPRYPESVFDDIVESAGLAPGDLIVEIGAGTGIATQPLVDLGFSVIAIEPSESLAAIAASHVSERAQNVCRSIRGVSYPVSGPIDHGLQCVALDRSTDGC